MDEVLHNALLPTKVKDGIDMTAFIKTPDERLRTTVNQN
jgi:hypothetical protein